MNNNPFTSPHFVNTWLKYFNANRKPYTFNFLNGVSFFKNKFLPLYVNVGRNLTKGLSYSIDKNSNDFKGKTFLIYDVPSYYNLSDYKINSKGSLQLKKLYQYDGFLMNLTNHDNVKAYIKDQFKVHNKRYIRWSHINRLEQCFDISYKFYFGEIDNETYNFVFDHFFRLLKNRFNEKHTNYHHLDKSKWNFYKEVVLPMIRNKQASFLVIYNGDMPIGINLNYHSDKTLYKAITVFDIDYFKFSIGKLSVIKLLEWCFENGYEISDFSKGDFDYKRIWSNTKYQFYYHILYDKSSIKSVITAKSIEVYYAIKLILRRLHVNSIYRKLIYMKNYFGKSKSVESTFRISNVEKNVDHSALKTVNYLDINYEYLKKHVYNFLFSNPEPVQKIKVYNEGKDSYLIVGSNKVQRINFY